MHEAALRVLLIEDDQVDRLACRRALTAQGRFACLEADTGQAGLRLAQAEAPDCILLDYRLPDMDGLEVLAELRAAPDETGVPVVMLTGAAEVTVAVEAMRRGARDYLVKDSQRHYLRLLPVVLERVVEQARVRAQQREVESRARALADAVPGLLAYVDSEERFRFCNARYEEWFGLSPQALEGKSLREFLGEEAYAHARPYIEGALAGQPQAFENLTLIRGVPHHLYLRLQPHRDGHGRPCGFYVAGLDISELKRAEQALRVERDFIAAVLRTAGALVLVLDREGRIVRLNEACEAVLGYRLEELLGKTFWDLMPEPDEAEALRRLFAELRTGLFPNRYENHWRHKDGSRRLIAWSNTALAGADGRVEYVIATGIDVTEQRAAEEQARRGQVEVERLFRQYALAAMASVFAHELNQPLTAIATYSEASLRLLRAGRTDGQLVRNLEQTALQAQRAAHMIRHVRNFLRRGELETNREDLNALVDKVMGQVAHEARQYGVRLHIEPGEIPRVQIERLAVEKVLLNLVHNALEAMRDAHTTDGVLTVRTRCAAEGFVQVTVEDTGPGLDPETAARLFQPFYTTKPEGLGMGLAISRTLVEAHGGRLWGENRRDGGAAFHFTLPTTP